MGEIIDKVAWIHIKDKKILATLSKGKKVFYIPGGKREGDETDEQTLFREIKEELDVEVVIETVQYLGVYEAQSDGAEKGIKVKMTCYIGDYVGELKASSEVERFEWLSVSDINKVSAVDKIIYLDLSSRGLIE
ncbi:NUDIX domain-containing protein [Schleiferiaceae bacterium]|nr:NUDIX domain-containing protein [Schleiferiaceae bacterium]